MNEAPKVPGNNPLPQGTTGGTNPKSAVLNNGLGMATNALDSITDKVAGDEEAPNVKPGDQVIDPKEPQVDEAGNKTEPEYKPGDKIAPGMEIGEDGKVKQSAVSRLQTGVAQGAAAYFSGGNTEAMQAAKGVSDSRTGKRIADQLEKNKVVNKVAEEAEESGALDTAEGVMNGAIAAKNLDVKGVKENAKKIKTGSKKIKKIVIKRVLISTLIGAFPIIMGLFIIIMAAASISDENDSSTEQVYNNTYEYEWDVNEDEPGEGGGDNSGGGSGATIPADEKLKNIFPDGIPTTEAGIRKYIVSVSVPITTKNGAKTTTTVQLHKAIADDVRKALQKAQDAGFKVYEVQGFSYRKISGSSKMSQHSLGLAVDINVNENYCVYPNGKVDAGSFWNPNRSEYSIPKDGALYNAFKSIGWGWGGDWKSKKDYMHFSYTGG